jgi:site-specific DNA recombinase
MRYVCNKMPGNNHCGKTYVLASSADEHVTQMVKVALDSPDFLKTLQARGRSDGDDSVLEQMTADQSKLEELAADYATDVITRKEWLRARELLEARLEAARKRLSTNSRPQRLKASVAILWRLGRSGRDCPFIVVEQ